MTTTHKGQVNPMKLPRHAEIWLLPYLKDRFWKSMRLTTPRRAWVAITDHYEPAGHGRFDRDCARQLCAPAHRWPRIAGDSHGNAAADGRSTVPSTRVPQISFG